MRKIRNEFQTCFDLFLFSLVSISSFFSLIELIDFYLFCQMKPTINWFSHFIRSFIWFVWFDCLNWLMEIESKWSSIDLFVCFKFSWMMMNQISSSHSYFYSLTYSDLALLIDLIDDWLIVEISLKWLISLISNFIIHSLIDLIKSFDIDWTKSDEIDVHFDCLFFSFDVSFIWIHLNWLEKESDWLD